MNNEVIKNRVHIPRWTLEDEIRFDRCKTWGKFEFNPNWSQKFKEQQVRMWNQILVNDLPNGQCGMYKFEYEDIVLSRLSIFQYIIKKVFKSNKLTPVQINEQGRLIKRHVTEIERLIQIDNINRCLRNGNIPILSEWTEMEPVVSCNINKHVNFANMYQKDNYYIIISENKQGQLFVKLFNTYNEAIAQYVKLTKEQKPEQQTMIDENISKFFNGSDFDDDIDIF